MTTHHGPAGYGELAGRAVYLAVAGRETGTVDTEAAKRARAVVVDDDRLFADALAAMLSADGRIEVIGCAHNGAEAVELVSHLEPDLVLMDISMPLVDGIEATRTIRAEHPSTCVLFLTGSQSSDDVGRASEVDAAGYLTKDTLSPDLVAAIFEIAHCATSEPTSQRRLSPPS